MWAVSLLCLKPSVSSVDLWLTVKWVREAKQSYHNSQKLRRGAALSAEPRRELASKKNPPQKKTTIWFQRISKLCKTFLLPAECGTTLYSYCFWAWHQRGKADFHPESRRTFIWLSAHFHSIYSKHIHRHSKTHPCNAHIRWQRWIISP